MPVSFMNALNSWFWQSVDIVENREYATACSANCGKAEPTLATQYVSQVCIQQVYNTVQVVNQINYSLRFPVSGQFQRVVNGFAVIIILSSFSQPPFLPHNLQIFADYGKNLDSR